jgi:membrane associated rhomboid family serine protease
MFMVPIYSDSAKYYLPIGTAILMAINIVVFVLQQAFDLEDFMLVFGEGLHPVQWLTAIFMHGGVGHLLGNLFFLFVFGLVIEGRIGILKFLPLYLGIGIAQSCISQVLFLWHGYGTALGASGVIYGLLAIAMIWCPQDTVKFFYFIFLLFLPVAVGFVDVPILLLGLAYLGLDGLSTINSTQPISTGLLHILGAAIGFPVALLLLWRKWVDTENRDLISLIQEARGIELKPVEKIKLKAEIREEQLLAQEYQQRLAFKWKSIDFHLAAGNAVAAVACYHQIKKEAPETLLDEARLLKIIGIYQKQGNVDEMLKYSQIYLDHYSMKAATVGLIAARALVMQKESPRKALNLLQKIGPLVTTSQTKEVAEKIRQAALRKIAAGDIEIS